ncbi:hypothetical protein ACERK3_09245 [Phycisphaerales bacterium AB-hyl4]|uniref:Uncharacterized protein n=1 Tax=Natronomicrosphaera hydrolytica TaxID=3242702 RepID=A0ABV4U7J7_9BACT
MTWQKCKTLTDGFHLKDQRRTGEHMPLGQGDTDVRAILEDAATAGWSGPCTLEPHLAYSKMMLANYAAGTMERTLADMSKADALHVAATEAQKLLDEIGVAVPQHC